MTLEDVLIVLISGGGSALLPIPTNPVTLSEKTDVIKLLANKGATINELNVVRIAISDIKGGKLLQAAKNAGQVVSLILSDIINDPIDLIASGPTVPFDGSETSSPIEIIEKYNLLNAIPQSVREVLNNERRTESQICSNSTVHVIGSNSIAIETSAEQAKILGFQPIVLSKGIQGQIQDLAANYTELAILVQYLMTNKITKPSFEEKLKFVKPSLFLERMELESFIYAALSCENSKGICFIAGGEPTATVTGSGKGGRNQELSLRFTQECQKRKEEFISDSILFLSAGTDGIDGPTTGAGAIGGLKIYKEFMNSGQASSCNTFIQNNDSFTFYKNLCKGKYHVITGHTGTNVMDLHLLIVPKI
jgi:glycerate 2-kinase